MALEEKQKHTEKEYNPQRCYSSPIQILNQAVKSINGKKIFIDSAGEACK